MSDLLTYAENTWCPGCGNFGILSAFRKAVERLEADGIGRERIAISAGIGCHAKIFDYLALSGLYSIHGREMATVEGMKLANPDLMVVAFAGDGDAFGEGISHLLFAAKRNADITVIVHDNGVYGLTTGQFTPTSKKGFRGPSTPGGSVEDPLEPLTLMLASGATFVARGYSGRIDLLADTIVRAVKHEGFSFVQVLQPCVTFNDTYSRYNKLVEEVETDAGAYDQALEVAKRRDKLPIGVIYETSKPVFHKELTKGFSPVRDSPSRAERLERVARLLNP